jgi:hypothetical protein
MSLKAPKHEARNGGNELAMVKLRDFPLALSRDVANELMRQSELIEPISESLARLISILPSLGLNRVMELEVARDPGAYPIPRFRIVITSTRPLPPEQWMKIWDSLSDAIDEPLRTYEQRRRVLLYLDPGW